MKNLRIFKVLLILSCIVIPLIVLSQKYQMKISSNRTGWVVNVIIKQAKLNSQTKTPKQVTTNKKIQATVGVSGLNVRERPSMDSLVVGKLNAGAKINVNDEQSGWTKIESTGVQGWVYTNYISKGTDDTNETQYTNSHTASTKPIQNSQETLKGKTIVLDSGHGGSDDGTTSIMGTHEKVLTLEIAKAIEQKLEIAGANVIMTRNNDTYIPLNKRVDISNQNHADAFISLHYNSYNDASINGLTDFYYQKSKDNTLATDIINEVVKTTRLKNDGTKFDDLEVLRNNSQPSTLIELGYLSNKKDDSIVESSTYPDHVAQGVYLGLLDYFSIKEQT